MSLLQSGQSNYKALQIKKFPTKTLRDTPENRFWRKFNVTYNETHKAVIQQVHSGNNDLNLISFTDGKSVQIYDTKKKTIKKSFTSFKADVHGLCIRKDGKLIATGQKDGAVKVFDVAKKMNLRTFFNHKKSVYAVHFQPNDTNLFTGSDDLNLRMFDIAGGQIVRTLPNAHTDFIRSVTTLPSGGKNVLTGSYDFKINMFDFNQDSNSPVMTFDHGYPVEDIAISPSGFQFVSVGGTYTTIWDVRTGKVLEAQNNNQKTVSTVQYLSTGDRFITGAVDNHMKIYRTDTFSVTHQYKLPHPIMALDFSQDTQNFAVGMSEGTLVIKSNKRKLGDDEEDEDEDQEDEKMNIIPKFLSADPKNHQERMNSYKYFNRGVYVKPQNYDLKYEEKKNKKLSQYDKFLKKFQYRECFITAFKQNQADIVLSLYEEYLQRNCLKHALSNLEDDEMVLVLEFIEKKIVSPKYSDMCIDITNIMTELYQFEAEQKLEQISKILEKEIEIQKLMTQLQGGLETVININLLQ